MRVFDVCAPGGKLHGFEVENTWLSRKGVARIVGSIPGVRIRHAKSGWFSRDDFCEFEVNGFRFVAEEPFGDNSRYWIRPLEGHHDAELTIVRERFLAVRRPEWISTRLFAALLMIYLGLSWVRSWAEPQRAGIASLAALGAALLVVGSIIAVSWALAVKRGHYRSRRVEEVTAPKRTG
jgi:hypothetical protein